MLQQLSLQEFVNGMAYFQGLLILELEKHLKKKYYEKDKKYTFV